MRALQLGVEPLHMGKNFVSAERQLAALHGDAAERA
jgi:hypothetical protein